MKNNLLYGVAALMITLGIATLFIGARGTDVSLPQNNKEFAKSTVSITAFDRKSGGSGVILYSSSAESWVLTNKHVCELIQVGGLVNTDQSSYKISYYKLYKAHDLCLVKVPYNLHVNSRIAQEAPDTYDTLITTGHPALLPTIISRGHFSSVIDIPLMVATAPCTGDEEGEAGLMCMFYGVRPIIKVFKGQSVSALIMPGSSGSGVFNDRGEIAGLVFAGPGNGIGYGFIVPHSYIKDFIISSPNIKWIKPRATDKPKHFLTGFFQIQNECSRKAFSRITNFCNQNAIPAIYSRSVEGVHYGKIR